MPAPAADEQFRCRPEQSVDGEGPAVGIATRQTLQHEPRVDGRFGPGQQIAGQDHLVQLTGPDPLHCRGDRCAPLGLAERPVGVGHRIGAGRSYRRRQLPVRPERGHPGLAVTPAKDDARDDERRLGRTPVERHAAEADRAGPGEVDRIVDDHR